MSKEKGMTLLEVVVSMLVVGLGLAITVSMLMAANRYGHSAEYRAVALREAQSIIDSMRTNKLGERIYVFGVQDADNVQYIGNDYEINVPAATPFVAQCVPGAEEDEAGFCDFEQQVAEYQSSAVSTAEVRANTELANWLTNLQTVLPGGQAAVIDAGGGNHSVVVLWLSGDENQRTDAAIKTTDSIRVDFVL